MNKINFTFTKQDDWYIQLNFQDNTGNPINITGFTFTFTIKAEFDTTLTDTVPTVTVTIHDDPVNGITHVLIPKANTNVATGNYTYELKQRDAAGLVTTELQGNLIINPNSHVLT